ncbi:hypothetical protein DXG01_011795, partial [Tephrocybe rancida]
SSSTYHFSSTTSSFLAIALLMSENDGPPQDSQLPQGSSSGLTIGTDPIPQPAPAANTSVESRIAACDKLVNDAVEGVLSAIALAESLKNLGLTAIEASDYIDEYQQRLEIRQGKSRASKPPSREPTPEGLSPDEIDTFRREREKRREGLDAQAHAKAVEEAAWTQLRAKLESTSSNKPAATSVSLGKMLEFLGASQDLSGPSSLSKSVLAVAPHLAETVDTVFNDPYLNQTQQAKTAYTNQKPFDNLIIRAQGELLREPIANSIWRLVILDKYVDFEKLYATLDPNYDHNDEAKDLNDDFSILKKHVVSAKRQFSSESEWMRLYDAWMAAALVFYPHRRTELEVYREIVVDMFRATSSPFPAIRYDRDARERYSRKAYRLDGNRDA